MTHSDFSSSLSVFATDYDGTIATHGAVDQATLQALRRARQHGKKLFLVTGREIDDLRTVFAEFALFDCMVAENGALLYWPQSGKEELLAEPPPPIFSDQLRSRGVTPLSVGRIIVATVEPHEAAVLDSIKELGLDLQVIFNKGAVMVLPASVNKATGLLAAMERFGLKPENAVGVGDAENDHAFLAACGYSGAVANALPALKKNVDFVASRTHGAGVSELIDAWLSGSLTPTRSPA